MSRTKTYDIKMLLRYIQEYWDTVCNHYNDKLTATNISAYIKQKGIHIAPYTIRRDQAAMELITKLQSENLSVAHPTTPCFHTIDVETFLHKNSNPILLRQALSELNGYYFEIYQYAKDILPEYEKQKKTIDDLQLNITRLEEKIGKSNTEIKTLQHQVEHLKKYIKETVNPSIAIKLLQEAGIINDNSEDSDILSDNLDIKGIDSDLITSNVIQGYFKKLLE